MRFVCGFQGFLGFFSLRKFVEKFVFRSWKKIQIEGKNIVFKAGKSYYLVAYKRRVCLRDGCTY